MSATPTTRAERALGSALPLPAHLTERTDPDRAAARDGDVDRAEEMHGRWYGYGEDWDDAA